MALTDWTRTKGWDISSSPAPSGDPGTGVSSGTHLKFEDAGGGTQLRVQVSGTEWSGVIGNYDGIDTLTGDLGKRTFTIVHNSATKKLACTIDPGFSPRSPLLGFGFNRLKKRSKKRKDPRGGHEGPSDAGSWTAIEGG